MRKKRYLIYLGILLLGAMMTVSCTGGSAQAKDGDTVKVHYTGTLGDGTVFDTSLGREPLEFTLGEGMLISGFEQAVLGMKVGESKTVTIPAAEAYGPHQDDLLLTVARSQLGADLEPEVGMQLQMPQPDGGIAIVPITEVTETTITVDTNHPMAGKDLTFEIKLVEIVQ